MKIDRFRPFRRLAGTIQAVVIIGLPFLKINGESALRFDVPSLRLYFFGTTIWMQEFFIVLVAVLFLVFLLLLVTLLFGRIWCGWLCPQTVLSDFTRFVDRAGLKGLPYRTASYLLTFGASVLVAATLIWYFVSPYEFFDRLLALNPGRVITWSWAILTLVIFADLAFIRQRFCATTCPYSRMQSTLYDSSTMIIAFDQRRQDECMNCSACVRTCPVNIDIRKGASPACINCAECIDKCRDMMGKRSRPGLIGYFFGKPGEDRPLIRKNALLLTAVTVSLLIFFIYLAAARSPLDLTVMPAYNFPPRLTADGRVINAYNIFLENRSGIDLDVRFRLSGPSPDSGYAFRLNPAMIGVKSGEHKKAVVFADGPRADKSVPSIDVYLTAEFGTSVRDRVEKKATFILEVNR